MNLEYVLSELRKELDAIDQAIVSLERLNRSGNLSATRPFDMAARNGSKGAKDRYRTAAPGEQ
jgi:hypothetical protein